MTKGAVQLKQFRRENGLTQEDVEKATGIPRSTLACIESLEKYNTSVITAKKLGEYLSIPWCLFFVDGGEDVNATNC